MNIFPIFFADEKDAKDDWIDVLIELFTDENCTNQDSNDGDLDIVPTDSHCIDIHCIDIASNNENKYSNIKMNKSVYKYTSTYTARRKIYTFIKTGLKILDLSKFIIDIRIFFNIHDDKQASFYNILELLKNQVYGTTSLIYWFKLSNYGNLIDDMIIEDKTFIGDRYIFIRPHAIALLMMISSHDIIDIALLPEFFNTNDKDTHLIIKGMIKNPPGSPSTGQGYYTTKHEIRCLYKLLLLVNILKKNINFLYHVKTLFRSRYDLLMSLIIICGPDPTYKYAAIGGGTRLFWFYARSILDYIYPIPPKIKLNGQKRKEIFESRRNAKMAKK